MLKLLNESSRDLDAALSTIVSRKLGWKLAPKSVASIAYRIQARVADADRNKIIELIRSGRAIQKTHQNISNILGCLLPTMTE